MSTPYLHAVVGGTFDHFHKGHQKLLDEAFDKSQNITIGITTEKLYKNKPFASTIESYDLRLATVKKYIKDKKFNNAVNFESIDDIYGTTLKHKEIDAIFVTEDNFQSAELINQKRLDIKFPVLTINQVALVNSEDGKAISSERIRKGEIDREGFVYALLFKNTLELPTQMRSMLREPFGNVAKDLHKVIAHIKSNTITITVGDIVTILMMEAGHQADLNIIDFKTRRHEINNEQKNLLKQLSVSALLSSNRAGLIEHEAVNVIQEAIANMYQTTQKAIIKIKGEEDLLTLPAILLAPLDSIVIYGLFDQGAVVVEVTEQKKKEIVPIIKQFTYFI